MSKAHKYLCTDLCKSLSAPLCGKPGKINSRFAQNPQYNELIVVGCSGNLHNKKKASEAGTEVDDLDRWSTADDFKGWDNTSRTDGMFRLCRDTASLNAMTALSRSRGMGLSSVRLLMDADCPPCLQKIENVSRRYSVRPITKPYCRSHQEIYLSPISVVDLQSKKVLAIECMVSAGLIRPTAPQHQQETHHVVGCTVGQKCLEKHWFDGVIYLACQQSMLSVGCPNNNGQKRQSLLMTVHANVNACYC